MTCRDPGTTVVASPSARASETLVGLIDNNDADANDTTTTNNNNNQHDNNVMSTLDSNPLIIISPLGNNINPTIRWF